MHVITRDSLQFWNTKTSAVISKQTAMNLASHRLTDCNSKAAVTTSGTRNLVEMSVGESMRNGVGFLTMLVIIAFEALEMVTSLNADGVALLEFKKGITSDPENALQGWTSSDATPCQWSGITCTRIQSTMEDRVVGIALPRRALGGTISPKLGDLGYLMTLSLRTNNLTGQIPAQLFNATALAQLYLSDNDFTGGIPSEIGNLGQQLRVLEIQSNRLTSLPHEIVSCYRLRRLILSNNIITGAIPSGMGSQLTQLERLDMSVNRFTGAIPDDFGNLTSLQPEVPLNLSNNLLSGAIPPSLANLQGVPIDLSNNNLSGLIPPDSYFQSQGPPAYVGNAALCGSPLTIDCTHSPSPSPSSVASVVAAAAGIGKKRSLSKSAVVGIAVGCAIAGFVLMATVVLYFVMRKLHISRKNLSMQSSGRRDSRSFLRGCPCSWRESAHGAMSAEDDDQGNLVHLSGVLSFNLEELLRASAYVLGKSGEGIVYKAVLDEGTVVAVRRLGEGGVPKQKEFIAEAKSIAQVRHSNVVTLHSYSWTADEKLLVYDYLPNGSLETALHGRSEGSKEALTWDARLRIARGAAQGIAHIHECSPRKYIHGDIKPSNILLDAFLEARIADFGLQRLLSLLEPKRVTDLGSARGDTGRASSVSPAPEFGRSSVSPPGGYTIAPFLTGVYQAPEAVNAKRPSQKSDVYSFGVVLLELLTGRSPFKQLAAGQHDLVSWMRFALQKKKALSHIFDPALLSDNDEQSKMIETLQVALACIAVNPDYRPKMKQVAEFFQQLTK